MIFQARFCILRQEISEQLCWTLIMHVWSSGPQYSHHDYWSIEPHTYISLGHKKYIVFFERFLSFTRIITKKVIITTWSLTFNQYSQSIFFSFLSHQKFLCSLQISFPFVFESIWLDLAVISGHNYCVDHQNKHTSKPHMEDVNSLHISF